MLSENDQKRLEHYRFLSEKIKLALIPLKPGKKIPKKQNWNKQPDTNHQFKESEFIEISENAYELMNAGVLTGIASNCIVIDVDDFESFNKFLIENKYELPKTFTVKSGGKSLHYYYSITFDEIGLRSRRLHKYGFDLLAENSCAVAPGSIHPDTGRIYEIENDNENIFTPAPDWMIELCNDREPAINKNQKEAPAVLEESSNPINIDQMPISGPIKNLIKNGKLRGQRSEAAMSVIAHLIINGIDNNEIRKIFELYPIGEKYREKGRHKQKYLEDEIESAREFVARTGDHFNIKDFKKYRRHNQPIKRCVTLADIMANEKELEFVIDRIWPKQSPLLIVGPSGVGKSNFVFNMAAKLACSGSQEFLGLKIINGNYKTLFIQSENSVVGVKRRFNYIRKGIQMGYGVVQNLIFPDINDDVRCTGDLESDDFIFKIENLIKLYQPQILAFDPLVSFHQADENANVQMRRVLDNLTFLGDENHINIVLIHHTGKSPGYGNGNGHGGRGASAIGDWAPNIIELQPNNDKNGKELVKLKHTKARDVEKIGEMQLIMDKNTLTFWTYQNQQNYDLVTQALSNLGGHANSQDGLINEIQRMSNISSAKNTIRKMITSAVQAGQIKKHQNGKTISYSF